MSNFSSEQSSSSCAAAGRGDYVPIEVTAPDDDDDVNENPHLSSSSVPLAEAVAVAVDEEQYVQVQAPSDLPANYELPVQVEAAADDEMSTTTMVVLVPEGGVREGQSFRALVLQPAVSVQKPTQTSRSSSNINNSNPHNIPTGRWRDSVCACCSLGCCHPSCCLSCFCFPIMLGQIMTRMKLSMWGGTAASTTTNSTPDAESVSSCWSPFKILLAGCIVMVVFQQFVSSLVYSYMNFDDGAYYGTLSDSAPEWVVVVLGLHRILFIVLAIYLFVLVIRTRRHIRQTYSIPEQWCCCCCCPGYCEDCCCACWCGVCTVGQMARHTADYRTYQAACCTDTGLGERAPPTLDPTEV